MLKGVSRFFLKAASCLWLFSALAAAEDRRIDPPMVGRYDGTVLTEDQMREELAMPLYEAEISLYHLKKDWIEKKAREAFFDQAAKEAGLSREDWEKREIDGQAAPPSASEVDQFVAKRVPPSQATKPDVIKRVTDTLTRQKRDKREEDVYQQLLAKHQLEISLAKPAAPRVNVSFSADDPARGPAQAPVTLLEFTDFQCPFCQRAQPILSQLEQAYPNQVKHVVRQFPLQMHPRARPAAEAALCAMEQGKFWEYQDKLFEKQELSDADFKRYAAELGLKQARFDKCVGKHKYAARIEADLADGQSFGVHGTPAFFVNGRPIVGGATLENFQEALNEELAVKK